MTNFTAGDVSSSQTLTDNDHLYPEHINELRQSRGIDASVGQDASSEYSGTTDAIITTALTAISAAGGGNVYVQPGTYTVSAQILIPSNCGLILSKATTLSAQQAFFDSIVTADPVGLVQLQENSFFEGGIIDGNDITVADGGIHTSGVALRTDNVYVKDVEVKNWGDDSNFVIRGESGTPIENVSYVNCFANGNSTAHGFQYSYVENAKIINCTAKDITQDGFRAYYEGKVFVENCVADNCRVGFQTWDQGNRRGGIFNCKAMNCTQHGFYIGGLSSVAVGLYAYNNAYYGIYVKETANLVIGEVNGNATDASYDTEVMVEGDANVVMVSGESSVANAVEVTGIKNHVVTSIHGVTNQYKQSTMGTNNTISTEIINFSNKPTVLGAASSETNSALMTASQVNVYVNEAGNALTFKVKYADGTTIKSGTVALA